MRRRLCHSTKYLILFHCGLCTRCCFTNHFRRLYIYIYINFKFQISYNTPINAQRVNADDILQYNEYNSFNKSLPNYISNSTLINISFTFIGQGVTTEGPTTTQHDGTPERQLTTPNDSTTTIQNTDIICTTPICISIVALLSLIVLFIIVALIVLLVLCCAGRVTCILPHAFYDKNTSKPTIQNSNDEHEIRQSYKMDSENEYQINKGDGRTTNFHLRTNNQFINES